MRRENFSPGYTIVEVMIFLIITGVLLGSAVLVFNGRQQSTRFRQAAQEINADVTTAMNEVQSGYYPNSGNFVCSGSGGILSVSRATNQDNQGQNEGCIFLGKAFRFGPSESFSIYTILGLQRTGGVAGTEVTTLAQAKPQALARFSTDPANTPDNTVSNSLPGTVTVTKVIDQNGNSIGGFAIIMSLGAYASGEVVTASQSSNLFTLPGTAVAPADTTSDTQFKNAIQGLTEADKTDKVTVCLSDGDRLAAIIVKDARTSIDTEVIINNVPIECKG